MRFKLTSKGITVIIFKVMDRLKQVLLTSIIFSSIASNSAVANQSELVSELRVQVSDIPGITSIIEYNDKLFFSAFNENNRQELHSFDPLTNSSSSLANFGGANFTIYKEKLFFTYRHQIWSYDDNSKALQLITDVNDTNGNEFPEHLTVYNNKLYFTVITEEILSSAELFTYTYELWAYNEEEAITHIVTKMYKETSSDFDRFLVEYDDLLFFNLDSLDNGNELWAYDSKTEASSFILDLGKRKNGISKVPFVFNEKLFLSNRDDDTGVELWSYDSTTEVFKLAADINPNQADSFPRNFIAYNNKLYFTAYDDVNGYEIWAYDDVTESHDMPFDTTVEGHNDFRPLIHISSEGKLFFNAQARGDGQDSWLTNEHELWFYNEYISEVDYAHTENLIKAPERIVEVSGDLYYPTYLGGIYKFASLNTAPEIVTPSEYTTVEGVELYLDASNSSDVNSDKLNFSWVQLSGPIIDTENSSSSIFKLFIPEVDNDEELIFQLTVDDGKDSNSIEVTVYIENINKVPTVSVNSHAVEFDELATATLIANGVDADNDNLTYQWEQMSGPQINFGSTSSPQLDITLPEVTEDMTVEVKVTVSDEEASAEAIAIFVIKNLTSNNEDNSEAVDTNSGDSGGAIFWLLIFVVLPLCRVNKK